MVKTTRFKWYFWSLGKPAMKRSVIPKALKKKLPLRIWTSIAIRHITGPKDFSLFLPIRCLTYLFNIPKDNLRN